MWQEVWACSSAWVPGYLHGSIDARVRGLEAGFLHTQLI